MKQRVDRAQNGRGTFILSRRHWQGKQEDLLITFALQLRSFPPFLSLFLSPPLSRLPSTIPIQSSAHASVSTRAIYPCPSVSAYLLLMPIRQLLWMNGAGAGYLARNPPPYPTWLSAIRRIDGCEPMTFFQRAVEQATVHRAGRSISGVENTSPSPPPPRRQGGKGGKNRVTIVETFEYLAHGPSKQLLNISGTDNTGAEGKQRVVVFRRRNNPSQIKTRKQTRERDVERARVRKLAFTLPSPPPTSLSPSSFSSPPPSRS